RGVGNSSPGPARAAGVSTAGPSTSTTTVTSPVQAAGPDTATISGPDGAEVTFSPDPQHPEPRLTGTAAPAAITRLTVGGAVWEVAGGALTVRSPNARRAETVPLGDLHVGAIAWAGGRLWALDTAAARIVAGDPATRRASPPADVVHPL